MRYDISFAAGLRPGALNTLISKKKVRYVIGCTYSLPNFRCANLPRADKRSGMEDPQADVWLKGLAVADRKLGAAPVNFDVFLQFITFQATIALRNKGINNGAVEVIAVKYLRLYLTLGRSDRRLGNCDCYWGKILRRQPWVAIVEWYKPPLGGVIEYIANK